MIKSMTGFGRGDNEENGRSFTVEIKTINHKYSDISIKLPRQLLFLEDNIRKYIMKYISRGKVDVFVSQESYNEDDMKVSINEALASSYMKALYELRDKYSLEDDITVSVVSKLPDILCITKQDENQEAWNALSKAIEKSIDKLIEMRETEGRKLAEDIMKRGKYIRELVKKIENRSPEVVREYKIRLGERIKEICSDIYIDENRLSQEVAIFADRSSITEEIVRMNSHLDQLKEIINENQPVGRKLDFLIQEINREINTIGSKASDIEITGNVVEIKSELEKIREQIQNIE